MGHPGVGRLLEALVSREVRAEIEALGGYSTRHTGNVVSQNRAKRRASRTRRRAHCAAASVRRARLYLG